MRPEEKRVVWEQACLACSGERGCDPHHFPRFRGGPWVTDGLLEVVPICRRCHDAFHDDGDPWVREMVARAAYWYFIDIYETYAGTGLYLGPEYRVEEIRADHRSQYGRDPLGLLRGATAPVSPRVAVGL